MVRVVHRHILASPHWLPLKPPHTLNLHRPATLETWNHAGHVLYFVSHIVWSCCTVYIPTGKGPPFLLYICALGDHHGPLSKH